MQFDSVTLAIVRVGYRGYVGVFGRKIVMSKGVVRCGRK